MWKKEVEKSLTGISSSATREERQAARRKIKELEKEIRKKDKALAELTALVVLKKKLEDIFQDVES